MDVGPEKVRCPWNKDKHVGQKLPLKPKEIWAVRYRLQLEHRTRDLALFSLGIDSKLRGCDLVAQAGLRSDDFLFPSRIAASPHLTTRQYDRILKSWVTAVGLDAHSYGTHSMRRTKATLIYRRTPNLRAAQLLLGHTKIESTVRYLGVEVDDALEIAEQTDV